MLQTGDLIYLKRLEKGLTQSELAEKARVPQSNLSDIEKGKRDITVSTLRKIAAGLDAHPRDFFEDEELPKQGQMSRHKIEHLAGIIAGKKAPIHPDEKELAGLFQAVLPKRGRTYVHDMNKSWLVLRRRFSASEIASIYERSDEFRRGKP